MISFILVRVRSFVYKLCALQAKVSAVYGTAQVCRRVSYESMSKKKMQIWISVFLILENRWNFAQNKMTPSGQSKGDDAMSQYSAILKLWWSLITE